MEPPRRLLQRIDAKELRFYHASWSATAMPQVNEALDAGLAHARIVGAFIASLDIIFDDADDEFDERFHGTMPKALMTAYARRCFDAINFTRRHIYLGPFIGNDAAACYRVKS